MTPRLPDRPQLGVLKQQAKSLLRDWRGGEARALDRLRLHHPKYGDDAAALEPTLREAQLVLAREHGFASWPKLKAYVEQADQHLADRFLDLACLNYSNDQACRLDEATALLAAHPALATASIWTAAAVGDATAVARFLDADPALLETAGGPQGWVPLLHACYGRVRSDDPAHGTLAVARLLLARGADANATFWWDDKYPFTALTGVCGEGESGPINQPRHPQWRAFAELLLDHGASPADSQALYNRMFSPDDELLELLLARGLQPTDLPADGSTGGKPPPTIMGYQIGTAASAGREARVRLLLDHGAHTDEISYGQTPWQHAMHNGHLAVARMLEAAGAPTSELSDVERFSALCLAVDEAAARAMLAADPTLIERAPRDLLTRAAGQDQLDAARLLLDLGYDVNAMGRITALHDAAWGGHTAMADLLLVRGADLTIRDPAHHGNPVDWANHAGKTAMRDHLLAVGDIDLYTAMVYGQDDRLRQLIAADPALLTRPMDGGQQRANPELAWETPLAAATRWGGRPLVETLLDLGADPTIRTPDGHSMADYARLHHHDELADYLGNQEA